MAIASRPQRRRATRNRLLLALLLLVVVLPGCWDRREIEDIGFVMTMGLDEVEDHKIALTVQIAVPRSIESGKAGQGGGEGAPPVVVERIVQPTVTEAIRELETFSSRRISFLHLKVVILGRRLAAGGVDHHIGVLTRNRELRRNIMIMVSDTTASEILQINPALEREPAIYLEDLTRRAYERTARAPRVDLHEFLKRYESLAQNPVLPIVRQRVPSVGLEQKPAPKPELIGTAVFAGGRMIGELSPDETELYLLLTGDLGSLVEVLPSPGFPSYLTAVRLSQENRDIQVDVSGAQPTFQMRIMTEAELMEVEDARRDLTTPDGLNDFEQRIAAQLEKKANALVQKLQRELESDIIGFGHHLRVRFVDWPSWQRYEWLRRFPQAKIQVTVQTELRRIGMTFQPPKREE